MVSVKFAWVVPVFASLALPSSAQELLHTFTGSAANDRLGNAVAGGMDVDGDGHPDVLVAAYAASPDAPEQGTVRVVSGWNGNELYRVEGTGLARLGFSVAFVGDVNGDGSADWIAGAPQSNLGGVAPGYVNLFSGVDGAVLWTHTGSSTHSDYGCSVTGVGDVDMDGFPDVAVGARYANLGAGTQSGAVYVYSGATGALLLTIAGAHASDWTGWSVADAGDVDADGCPDLAIGVVGWDEGAAMDAGAVEIRSLCGGTLVRRLPGLAAHEAVGWGLAAGRDVDGDGHPDVVAGASGASIGGVILSGGARVYSGFTGALLWTFGGGTTFADAGLACALADVDGDGHADIVVGSPGQPPSWTCGGRVDVWSGATGLELRDACGASFEDSLGTAVAFAGDVNHDGFDDVILGASMNDAGGNNAGAAYVLSGFECASPTTYCQGLPNSVGTGARIGWSGSASLAWNHFTLTCSGLPAATHGQFFAGSSAAQAIFGDGYRCAGGSLVRLGVITSSASGTVSDAFDTLVLHGGVALAPGDTRYFQFWYRNQLPGGSGFNLSDGLRVVFCP